MVASCSIANELRIITNEAEVRRGLEAHWHLQPHHDVLFYSERVRYRKPSPAHAPHVLHVGDRVQVISLQQHASRDRRVRGILRLLSDWHAVVFDLGQQTAVVELQVLRVGNVEQGADRQLARAYAAKKRDVSGFVNVRAGSAVDAEAAGVQVYGQ